VPVPIPLTVPALLIVATLVLLLAHVPPAVLSDRVVVEPLQIAVVPLIDETLLAVIVMVMVLLVVPHALVTA